MTTARLGILGVAALLLSGCGDDAARAATDAGSGATTDQPDASSGGPAPDAGTWHDAGGESQRDAAIEEPPFAGPGVFGVLLDHDRQPLAFEKIFACMTTVCLSGLTDADGRFGFELEQPQELAVKTLEDLSATPRRGALLFPVQLREASALNLRQLRVPSLAAGTRLDASSTEPETLTLGDGLQLTLRGADLTPRLGDELVDAAARSIPRDGWPTLPSLGEEPIVAIYALHPFAAKSQSPIGVRAALALPAGTRVRFRTISEVDGDLSTPVSGTADGSVLTTEQGSGITELTWLVISRAEP
jgi:hypothetical protein